MPFGKVSPRRSTPPSSAAERLARLRVTPVRREAIDAIRKGARGCDMRDAHCAGRTQRLHDVELSGRMRPCSRTCSLQPAARSVAVLTPSITLRRNWRTESSRARGPGPDQSKAADRASGCGAESTEACCARHRRAGVRRLEHTTSVHQRCAATVPSREKNLASSHSAAERRTIQRVSPRRGSAKQSGLREAHDIPLRPYTLGTTSAASCALPSLDPRTRARALAGAEARMRDS